jgi:hypothetical protein
MRASRRRRCGLDPACLEFGLEAGMQLHAPDVVEAITELLVVVDYAVVPVPRGEGLRGAPRLMSSC